MRIFFNKNIILKCDILTIIIFINNVIKNYINIRIDILIIYLNNKYILTRVIFVIIIFVY